MARFKTIKGLSKYLAQANQQDKAAELEHRHIWHIADFTPQDLAEIEVAAAKTEATIQEYKYKAETYADFIELIKRLEEVLPYLFWGFDIQNNIAKLLPYCDISK